MDRLLHPAQLVVMDGPSYRTQRTSKRKAGSAEDKQEVVS